MLQVILLLAQSVTSETPSQRPELSRPAAQNRSRDPQQGASGQQPGTAKSPIVVEILPTPKTEEETEIEAKDRAEKAANDRKLVEFTGELVIATVILGAVGLLQLLVFGIQSYYLRLTVRAAGEQSGAMERAITEANRSASAMETVAKHIETSIETAAKQSAFMERSVGEASRLASAMEVVSREIAVSAKAATDSVAVLRQRTAQQMRAYLAVVIGAAVYQERTKLLKFEGKPLLINTGHTPANKVGYRASAAILAVPLPGDFDFPLPDKIIGEAMLGPQQHATLSVVVADFCEDGEVENIKLGRDRCLYVWGIVTYEDIFGEAQTTRFCQSLTWLLDGKVYDFFIPGHNDAS